MSYEPTTWKSGDVVTSAKLNKIEQGISSNDLFYVVNIEGAVDAESLPSIDKTNAEIYAAHNAGKIVIGYDGYYTYKVTGIGETLCIFSMWIPIGLNAFWCIFFTVNNDVVGEYEDVTYLLTPDA